MQTNVYSGWWLLRFRIARKALKQCDIKEQLMARIAAIVVAAGHGVRAGRDLPKQFRRLGGDTLLQRALSAFTCVSAVSLVQPVIRPADPPLVRTLTDGIHILPPASPRPPPP